MAYAEHVGPTLKAVGIPWCSSISAQRRELVHDGIRFEDGRRPRGMVVVGFPLASIPSPDRLLLVHNKHDCLYGVISLVRWITQFIICLSTQCSIIVG